MAAVQEAEGADPGEVAGAAGGAEADEASVDVEVDVGDEREVVIFLAVEEEDAAVTADEARVVATGANAIALRLAS